MRFKIIYTEWLTNFEYILEHFQWESPREFLNNKKNYKKWEDISLILHVIL